jgi:predicted dehydrogenase
MIPAFGLIGAAWRAEFFLRIARDMPEQFPLAGVVVRDAEKRERLRTAWSVPVFATVEELLAKGQPAFVVTSVPWAANLPLMEFLATQKMPVLSETPIAPDLKDLHRVAELAQAGARIQLAEQYLFQPMHAARLKLITDFKLGEVHEADVSFAHGYHGISLLRNYLQAGLRLPKITARKFQSRVVAGPGRAGPPKERAIGDSERLIAQLDYGDKLGIFDFTGDQYFSWIRSPRLLVRGEEGEINNDRVRLLQDFRTPIDFTLARQETGQEANLEGRHLRAILGGGEILYTNPFAPARWSDDEIAVATCLAKMQTYVEKGESFYGVPEACHDRYLDILISQAAAKGTPVEATDQPWL